MSKLDSILKNDVGGLFVACTGAGMELQRSFWGTPGSSAYLAGCELPYAESELRNFLGCEIEGSYCSMDVATNMAISAYLRAAQFRWSKGDHSEKLTIGIGVSASVASTRLPRGDQRCHIAIITSKSLLTGSVTFISKGIGEDVRRRQDLNISTETRELLERSFSAPSDCPKAALELLHSRPRFTVDGKREPPSGSGVYLPSSLNPLHDGHRVMRFSAESELNKPVTFTIAADVLHKDGPSLSELLDKIAMVREERWQVRSADVEVTRKDPLFIDKARQRPGSHFVVGVDTMERLLDPKWVPDVIGMLAEFEKLSTKFLVMGRKVGDRFATADDIEVPGPYRHLFQKIRGRADVSSTELRNGH